MNGHDVVEAGGIGPLPAGGAVSPGGPAEGGSADGDLLTVRVYRHPGFGDDEPDRPVVRLVPSMLGAAEDLTMGFLGFTDPEYTAVVGTTGRQALGFPAWALVHDPANGRHALALVKDLRKLARQAATKPGAAIAGYHALARRLDGAAPQFLPTFWEEAGRALIAGENVKFASTCFNLAREAEKAHALAIDEERVAEVFLEYAMAGALPVKAISQYAKDLGARAKPDAAYERFRTVTIRRVASGLPPYSSLPAEVKRLASAAGLDGDAAAEDVVVELLGLAATARSAPSTWKALRPIIVRAARRRPGVRGQLLAMMPDPPGYNTDLTDEWIDLLVASGADAALTGEVAAAPPTAAPPTAAPPEAAPPEAAPPEAAPPEAGAASPDGPAGWLERIAAVRGRRWRIRRSVKLLALVERMVPALCAAGRPVRLTGGQRVDLDLIDVCLAGDVGVEAAPDEDLDVSRWIDDTLPGARDLTALATDDRFAARLRDSTVQSLRHTSFDRMTTIVATPGLRTALSGWLRAHAASVPADPTLAGLNLYTAETSWMSTAGAASIDADAVRSIAGIDLAAGLTRTLRTGLLEEFAWPAIEESRDELPNDFTFNGSWPYLVYQGEKNAVVLGPRGVVLRHAYPKRAAGWWQREAVWIPGVERLFVFTGQGNGYWADAPDHVLATTLRSQDGTVRAMPLPGGGATFGGAPWQPGDESFPEAHRFISDGTRYWQLRHVDNEYRWWPYDPATGAATAGDPPAFFAEDGLLHWYGDLAPAPAEFAASPLGYADGLVGFRLRDNPDGTRTGTRVDGREMTFPATIGHHSRPVGGLVFPGADRLCPVFAVTTGPAQRGFSVYTPSGDQLLAAGSPAKSLPPTDWWHAWQVRDAAGSAALRATEAGAVRSALAVVTDLQEAADLARAQRIAAYTGGGATGSGVTGGDEPNELARKEAEAKLNAAVTEAVTGALPGITASRLRRAVVAEFRSAARTAIRLRTLRALADNPPGDDQPTVDDPPTFDPGVLMRILRDVSDSVWLNVNDCRNLVNQLTAIPRILAGGPIPEGWPHTDVAWPELLVLQDRLVLRALAPGIPAEERETLSLLMSLLAATGLAEPDGTVRVVRIRPGSEGFKAPQVIRTGERLLIVQRRPAYNEHVFTAVEVDPSGQFGPLPTGTIAAELRAGWGGRARLEAVVTALTEQGPPPWFPAAVASLAADAGMSRGAAALVLAGGPNLSSHEANFLAKETRATLGITATEARSGRALLQSLKPETRHRLILAAMPDDPAGLWTTGPNVAKVAEVWRQAVGDRLTVPDDILADATGLRHGLQKLVIELAGGAVWLRPTMANTLGNRLSGLAIVLPWLVYRLPRESPLRAAVPGWYEQLRALLAAPATSIEAGWLPRGTPLPPSVAEGKHRHDSHLYCELFTAKVTGADDPALAMFPSSGDVQGLRRLLDPGMAELIESVRADGGGTGWAHDPTTVGPELVAEVAERHGVGTEAAAYYLQVLALPDPTDRNVQRWNGWAAAQLKKARAELVAAGLVVEAKRDRAGRTAFLPGGWQKTPGIEDWKLATPGTDADWLVAPVHPTATLFRAAWQRIVDGDPPRLRDLGAR